MNLKKIVEQKAKDAAYMSQVLFEAVRDKGDGRWFLLFQIKPSHAVGITVPAKEVEDDDFVSNLAEILIKTKGKADALVNDSETADTLSGNGRI